MTAMAIGRDVDPGAVKVSKAVKDGSLLRWTAETPFGHYACSASEGHTSARCSRT